MKEIFQLPNTLPIFYNSNSSESVLVEFNNEDVLYIIGIVNVRVVEGKIETWGFTMTKSSPMVTLYSSGSYGLISIASVDGRKAVILLEKSIWSYKWQTFMNEYIPSFNMFDVIGTRLTPPKPLLELEEQLGCWFDLSKTPISNRRLIIEEQWLGFSNELLNHSIDKSFKVLFAGYKNAGKSVMMQYFLNKCLKKWNKILVLDFDIGQSEFSLPGCISAFIIDEPLLGPNFTHLKQPIKSYYFGSTNVMTNVCIYMEIVRKIVDDIKTENLNQIPCLINTMGFVEGEGLKILYDLICKTQPSDVIQVKLNEKQDLNLHSEVVNDNMKSSLSYNLWYFTSLAKNKLAKAPYFQGSNCNKQYLLTTSYFSKCLKSTDIYFNDVIPFKINICDIDVQINNVEELTQDECLDVINANVIALCVSFNTDFCECVGFGFVRNVNKSTGDVFIITPVTLNILNRVNHIRLGNVYLPPTFYTKGTQTSKYVCVKQNNIFNENVTRHYKVMS